MWGIKHIGRDRNAANSTKVQPSPTIKKDIDPAMGPRIPLNAFDVSIAAIILETSLAPKACAAYEYAAVRTYPDAAP